MTIIEQPKDAVRRESEETPRPLDAMDADDESDVDDEFSDDFEEALRHALVREGIIADG